ncbi:MAG TPA: hypothetical protein VLT88_01175 [Desulfosarcina sp.]|nr:hypothetical protein [Desulfosarcina sp.]
MPTKFYCNSERCTHADRGPFVLEIAQEAVMDGNNMATIFCPKCGKPMKPLTTDPQHHANSHRFYCHNEACSGAGSDLFFIDLPEEAIMDKNNMATIFCPKCGREMNAIDLGGTTVVNY